MEPSPYLSAAPNAARGEVKITIAGQAYPVRFGMNVMRDFSKATGSKPSDFGQLLAEDYDAALSGLVGCAVRRYVPGQEGITQDAVCDLIDGLSAEEADAIAEAITEAVTVGNPLLRPLTAKVAAKNQAAALLASPTPSAPSENGSSTSSLPTAS